ncbi:MAG: hypothetical protein AB7F39_06830 [Variibacter sp.]
MKAVPVWQPRASMIFERAIVGDRQPYDYRKTFPHLQGERVVIVASRRFVRPDEVMDMLVELNKGSPEYARDRALPIFEKLSKAAKCQGVVPLGCALGTVALDAPRYVEQPHREPGSDQMRAGYWLWPMRDPRPFAEPVPIRAERGIFDWAGPLPAFSEVAA